MPAKPPERLRNIPPSDHWDEHLAEWQWVKKFWYVFVLAFAIGLCSAYLVWG